MKFFKYIIAGLFIGLTPALAQGVQDINGCTPTNLIDPPRIVYTCENGLVIEAEAMVEIEAIQPLQEGDAATTPQLIQLNSNAVLISLPTGQGPFQIMTPHAIASVRGTTYVVDVTAEKTAVFVVEGVVAVAKDNNGISVDLKAGEGVTVSDQNPLLEVKTWPLEKVTGLMARFAK